MIPYTTIDTILIQLLRRLGRFPRLALRSGPNLTLQQQSTKIQNDGRTSRPMESEPGS